MTGKPDYYIGARNDDVPEFYVEPWVGFRTWRMTDHHRLMGVAQTNAMWSPDDDTRATCLDANHEHPDPPVPECMCGYWAYTSYSSLQVKSVVWHEFVKTVRGAVIGWGRMRIHSLGWRSEFARPIAFLEWLERRNIPRSPFLPESHLAAAEKWNKILVEIAEIYNVPILATKEELIDYASNYSTLNQ